MAIAQRALKLFHFFLDTFDFEHTLRNIYLKNSIFLQID